MDQEAFSRSFPYFPEDCGAGSGFSSAVRFGFGSEPVRIMMRASSRGFTVMSTGWVFSVSEASFPTGVTAKSLSA